MNKQIRIFLKKKKFLTGLPTVVKFTNQDGSFTKVEASKGTYVMKYSDVLKLLKLTQKTGEKDDNNTH